jgi:hypothetical protein
MFYHPSRLNVKHIISGSKGIILTIVYQVVLNEILYHLEQASIVDYWGTSSFHDRLSKIHHHSLYCYFAVACITYIHESQYIELITRLQKTNNHKTEFLCKTSHELR